MNHVNYAAVVDTSTAIALVRGGVFVYLGQVFNPVFIGSGAQRECRRDTSVNAVLNLTQAQNPPFPLVESIISRSHSYDPNLSRADIEGIEVALDRSAFLLTQDDLQTIEAKNAHVLVMHTFDLLDGFKRKGFIPQVRPILDQMEQNGESYLQSEKNRLLSRVNEPLIP